MQGFALSKPFPLDQEIGKLACLRNLKSNIKSTAANLVHAMHFDLWGSGDV